MLYFILLYLLLLLLLFTIITSSNSSVFVVYNASVCIYTIAHMCSVHIWRLENNFQESVHVFHLVEAVCCPTQSKLAGQTADSSVSTSHTAIGVLGSLL